MRRGEFQIIDRFFTHDAFGEWRSQGVGDDCAIIDMPGNRIAVTTDMMAVGTHFLPGARPEDIGYKALAVNLSDLRPQARRRERSFSRSDCQSVTTNGLRAFPAA